MPLPSPATGAASTRTFFTHCRGRIALITPVIRLPGGPVTTSSLTRLTSINTSAAETGGDPGDGGTESDAYGNGAGIVHPQQYPRQGHRGNQQHGAHPRVQA